MKPLFATIGLSLLASCGSSETAAPVNEATRVTGDLERQSKAIAGEAENGAAAIERAMENQAAVIFDQRENPFNDSGVGNEAEIKGEVDLDAPAPSE